MAKRCKSSKNSTNNASIPFNDTSQNFPKPPTHRKNSIPRPLTPRQRTAIDLLLSGQTDSAIASALNVSRRTLYAWRQIPLFRQALDHRRIEIFQQHIGAFSNSISRSLDRLNEQLTHPAPLVVHRAASSILRASRIGHLLVPTSARPIHNSS